MKRTISTLLLSCLILSSPLKSDEAQDAPETKPEAEQVQETPKTEPSEEAPASSAPYEVGAASEDSSRTARNGQLKSIGIAAGVVAIAVTFIIIVSRSQGRHHS